MSDTGGISAVGLAKILLTVILVLMICSSEDIIPMRKGIAVVLGLYLCIQTWLDYRWLG